MLSIHKVCGHIVVTVPVDCITASVAVMDALHGTLTDSPSFAKGLTLKLIPIKRVNGRASINFCNLRRCHLLGTRSGRSITIQSLAGSELVFSGCSTFGRGTKRVFILLIGEHLHIRLHHAGCLLGFCARMGIRVGSLVDDVVRR